MTQYYSSICLCVTEMNGAESESVAMSRWVEKLEALVGVLEQHIKVLEKQNASNHGNQHCNHGDAQNTTAVVRVRNASLCK